MPLCKAVVVLNFRMLNAISLVAYFLNAMLSVVMLKVIFSNVMLNVHVVMLNLGLMQLC
jgi:hypothetical protein